MYKRLVQEAKQSPANFKIHDKLHPKIWNGMEIDAEVRKRALEIASEFDEFMAQPKLKLVDVVLVGSLANYNYVDDSDFDLHLIYDVDDQEGKIDVADFFATKRYLWGAKHEIFMKGIAVEVSPQGNTGETGKLQSDGVFSLKNNKWIHKPEKYTKTQKAGIDNKKIAEAGEEIIAEIKAIISNKSTSVKTLQSTFTKLKDSRKRGLKTADGEIAFDNLVYKYVRGKGYVLKLLDYIDKLTDDQLTL